MDLFTKEYHPPGTMPGTLPETDKGAFSLTLLNYNQHTIAERTEIDSETLREYLDTPATTWIHVQGSPPTETLRDLAAASDIHYLHLEGIANTGQHPKLEVLENQVFLVLNLAAFEDNHLQIQQVCLFLRQRAVISFCTGKTNPFALVYQHLGRKNGKIRRRDAGYLFYTLIDTIVDHGYPLLEAFADKIQVIEDALLDNPSEGLLKDIHQVRRDLLLLRRRLWPQRDVINQLLRYDEDELINADIQMYFRDCYDHSITMVELLETYHEITSGLLDIYLSSVSHQLNKIMRVLTVITTLFIPPTFVVGIYGMNFDPTASPYNMPELGWPFGYLLVWLVILLMAAGMLIFFRRHRWF